MTRQEEIKDWFDQTYRTKGEGYLRPVAAYEIFGTLIDPGVESRHLDVACGPGLMLQALTRQDVQLHGVDISSEAIRQCRLNVPEADVLEANAEDLPYEDNTFDSITCIGSLERMLDRQKVLAEQYRVAKPGARLCYMVRNAENLTWKYLWKPLGLQNTKGHQDALTLKEWKDIFGRAGLKTEAIYPDHWPYYRIKRWFMPGHVDCSAVRKFPFSLELAYEFIFVTRKP